MGEEKFYSPREDLEALIAAIESLEISIEALDTGVAVLAGALLRPDTEAVVTGSETVDAGFNNEVIINEVLHATKDTYLVRARVVLTTTEDIFLQYDADIDIAITYNGTIVYSGMYSQPQYSMFALDAGRTFWAGERMIDLKKARIPAGETLTGQAFGYALSANTTVAMWVWYLEEVVI